MLLRKLSCLAKICTHTCLFCSKKSFHGCLVLHTDCISEITEMTALCPPPELQWTPLCLPSVFQNSSTVPSMRVMLFVALNVEAWWWNFTLYNSTNTSKEFYIYNITSWASAQHPCMLWLYTKISEAIRTGWVKSFDELKTDLKKNSIQVVNRRHSYTDNFRKQVGTLLFLCMLQVY